jgi:hypothetical protein
MKRALLFAFVLAAGAAAQENQERQPEPGKLDARAKETVDQFMKAMTAHDIDATMKVVDVPFFWDGVEIIKNRDFLKQKLEEIFKRNRIKGLGYDLKEVWSFGNLPQKAASEKDKKLLGQILDKDDRVVLVLWKPPGMDGLVAAVRFRDGKAKVAGFRD